jgi:hypothetical protein
MIGEQAPDAHFAAAGRIASLWAEFELQIDAAAIKLARVAIEPGLCPTSQVIGPARKLDAYIALAELRINQSKLWRKIRESLYEFAKDSAILAERRNRIVHDPRRLEAYPVVPGSPI